MRVLHALVLVVVLLIAATAYRAGRRSAAPRRRDFGGLTPEDRAQEYNATIHQMKEAARDFVDHLGEPKLGDWAEELRKPLAQFLREVRPNHAEIRSLGLSGEPGTPDGRREAAVREAVLGLLAEEAAGVSRTVVSPPPTVDAGGVAKTQALWALVVKPLGEARALAQSLSAEEA